MVQQWQPNILDTLGVQLHMYRTLPGSRPAACNPRQ